MGADITWRGERISRLVLGTAQLGMPYGIANTYGRPSRERSFEIVRAAVARGISFFDTAQAYGDSEQVLGECFRRLTDPKGICVISKLDPALEPANPTTIYEAIRRSCHRLGRRPLWALLLHRAEWLDYLAGPLGEVLAKARAENWFRYLGVSVYGIEEAERALRFETVDILQVPCNAWDQRMLRSGILKACRQSGRMVFVRSVYLQGLLLLPPEEVSRRLPLATHASRVWWDFARRCGKSVQELAMSFALSLGTPLVVGAETPEQFLTNVFLLEESPMGHVQRQELEQCLAPYLLENLLDPRRWEVVNP